MFTLPRAKDDRRDSSASSGFLEQFAKSASSLITINFTRRHVDNELFPIVDRQFPVG